MMISLLQSDPRQYFAIIIVVIVSIILHELAHGWVAVKLGDDTPIETGHMDTLNPLVHMGWFSLLLLAVVGIAFGAMPINPSRLRGKYAESWVALAGPAMNLVLAVLSMVALSLWVRADNPELAAAILLHPDGSIFALQQVIQSIGPENNVKNNGLLLLVTMCFYNIALAIFNLIPVPPLDGSRVAFNMIPAYRNMLSSQMAQGFMIAIFFAMFMGGAGIIFGAADFLATKGTLLLLRAGNV